MSELTSEGAINMDAHMHGHANGGGEKENRLKSKKSRARNVNEDSENKDDIPVKRARQEFEIDKFSEQLKLDGNAAIEGNQCY